MNKKLGLRRILNGKVSVSYFPLQKWNCLLFYKMFSGCLFYLCISKFNFVLDCRKKWIKDMINGSPD